MPDIHPLIDAEYTPYDIGVMGELDVRMLAELFGGREIATGLAPAWDGGLYYAAQRKSAVTDAEKESTASISLLYYSRWKNADSARSFMRIYANQIPRKYSGVVRRDKDEADDEQVFSTNEGDVLISRSGSKVFVGEGFDLALSRKLRDSIARVQTDGPMHLAALPRHEILPQHEPSLAMARLLESFGAMNAGSSQRYTSTGATLKADSVR
jgi:hypothetical protein